MIERLNAKLRGMVSRAVVSLVKDAMKLQELQVTLQAEQVPDDVEHFQHYGFTSVPKPGAEGIALSVGGTRAHTVVINVDDRRFRLKHLESGEVAIYDDQGQRVHLTRGGIVVDGGGKVVTVKNTPKVRMESDLDVTGNIKDRCDDASSRTMAQMRASHSTHTHTSAAAGQPTSQPNQAL